MTRKLPTMLVIALILMNVSWSQPPEIPLMLTLTCKTVQLGFEDGKPAAGVRARLKIGTVKVLKKLKTDAAGKIQLPELKPQDTGPYYLELPGASNPTIYIPDPRLGDCTQAFVLNGKGNKIRKEPAAPEKATDKK